MIQTPIQFNLLDAPLDGRSLIEASAGTGKTYALAGLFLRFILEKKSAVGEILAVTFTEAAAEELRGRIHALLREAKGMLEHPNAKAGHDPLIAAILSKSDPAQSLDAIVNALRDFDSCALFTIHGFCRRLLFEFAFESDQLLNAVLIDDQTIFVREIVEDFWRVHFSNASLLFSAFASGRKITPSALISLVNSFVSYDDVRIVPDAPSVDIIDAQRDFLLKFQEAGKLWMEDKSEIAQVLQSASLDGRKYGKCVPALLQSLDAFLKSEAPDPADTMKFEKITTRILEKSVKKCSTMVCHDFFDVYESLFDSAQFLVNLFDGKVLYLKSRLIHRLRGELEARKKRENVLFYDDLLLQVRQALSKKTTGNALAALVRKKYRAVLIDEFQDTDPLQCGIFLDLFSEDISLFLIGDPKQSIYGFRGADIFAYLSASQKVGRVYTLSTNYRSEKRLVKAINTIFGKPNSFVFEDIIYHSIAASDLKNKFSLQDAEKSRFIVWFLERNDSKGNGVTPLLKGAAETRVSNAVAMEISSLLNLSNSGGLQFHGKKILPTDIAVLVRTNREADLIYNVLIKNGIAATIQNNMNVFKTEEALDLYRLLLGMTNAMRLHTIRAALSTMYYGYNANDINKLNSDQALMDHCISVFTEYHELWKNAGFMRMVRVFMAQEKVRIRLLSMPMGERRLTNFLHLVELVHQKESSEKLYPVKTCKFLLNKILQESPNKSDEEVLRLEKDDNAIRVMTIHKSKGLEFPIVFCPFSWEGSEFSGNRKKSPFLFHDQDDNYLQKIALGDEEIAKYRGAAEQEQLAENIRLLYVALTRAKYCCYCSWGMVSKSETSAFAYLFHGNNETPTVFELGSRLKGMPDDLLRKEIQLNINRSDNSIETRSIPASVFAPNILANPDEVEIVSRDFKGSIPESWKISSFSSLSRFHSFEEHQIDFEPIEISLITNINVRKTPKIDFTEFNIFNFPKGKITGLFFHDIFEHLDFNNAASDATRDLVLAKLQEYEFDSAWSPTIIALINSVMAVPLVHEKGKFALNEILTSECLREMEFLFPLKSISSKQLNDFFSYTVFGDPGLEKKKIGRLEFSPARGFVKGFIDLIFRHEGRYFIVDWKSNYLGDTIEHFNYQAIKKEMTHEFYYLQSYIYLVALHEFLSKRMPEYNYNDHFGGIYYLFLRGIDKKNGDSYGVYFDRPKESLVNEFRKCLINIK
jgi:exodeoxyribonuclease V beta subunit